MGCAGRALRPYRVRKTLAPAVSGSLIRHDAEVATFASGLRAPFARYWLSGFLADFGDGVRLAAFPLLAVAVTVLAWRHRQATA